LAQLNGRTWLLHWSLLLFFRDPSQVYLFAQLAFDPPYEMSMQLMSRHLVRYLFVSLLLSQREDTLPACDHFLKQTAFKYTDEFTAFVQTLTQSFAFDSMPATLAAMQKVYDRL
jgi:translation initiation factor 3 subunit E